MFVPSAYRSARGSNFIRIALFLSLSSIQSLNCRRRRCLPSNGRVLLAREVKQARRGTRQRRRRRKAGTKKTCFGCGRTHSDRRSGKKPVLARTAYLLLVGPSRPSETLKLLSCLGILGEPTGDQLTPSVPCASVRPPAAVCLLLKIKQFERWNERLPAGGPRSSPPSSLFPHTSFGGLKHSLRIYSGATLTVVAGVPVPRYSRIFSFSHP